MLEKSDEVLVARAIKGRKRAWTKLLSRYEKAIYNHCFRMTGNRDDALDLMQDVFISVFRNLSSYRADGHFRNWLFRIAHYRCVEFFRRKKDQVDWDDVPALPCVGSNPEKQCFDAASRHQLVSAMSRLPLGQRTIVELKYFQQFTFEEIAGQIGISSNTVKSRLYAALDKLKRHLEFDHADL